MPRDGFSQYSIPPGTEGIADTTIESAKYNGFVRDIEYDLNWPRPIVAGGTGAGNADQALLNLKAERAGQVVTNYANHIWMAGSFYSSAGATDAPTAGGNYVGTALFATTPYITLEATNIVTGEKHIRQKVAGEWGLWFAADKDMDNKKVNRSGDTMTGQLTLSLASPYIALNKAVAGYCGLYGAQNSVLRWRMDLGDGVVEAGSNTGSDFALVRFNDAGTSLGTALHINRATAKVTLDRELQIGSDGTTQRILFGSLGHAIGRSTSDGSLTIGGGQADVLINNNPLRISNSSDNSLVSAGGASFAKAVVCGGDLYTSADIGSGGFISAGTYVTAVGDIKGQDFFAARSSSDGVYRFGSAGSNYIYYNAGAFTFAGGPLVIPAGSAASHAVTKGQLDAAIAAIPTGSYLPLAGGTMTGGVYFGANGHVIYRNGADGALYIGGGQSHVQINNMLALPSGVTGNLGATGNISGSGITAGGNITATGTIIATDAISGRGLKSKPGSDGAAIANLINFHWTGSAVQIWTDNTNRGNLSVTSDYRVKKDIEPLQSCWAGVKELRPVAYTHADYGELFRGDDEERWGFIAHELQETLLPTAATGHKDAEDCIQSPDPWPVLAAVTRALQEAMARIEELEGKLAQARK